jgi:hypothetical protein
VQLRLHALLHLESTLLLICLYSAFPFLPLESAHTMCQYSSKRYTACGHAGSRTDLVVTAYCGASISGQYCQRVVAGIFTAPGMCPPCQDRMAGTPAANTAYYEQPMQDDNNPETFTVQIPQQTQQTSQVRGGERRQRDDPLGAQVDGCH